MSSQSEKELKYFLAQKDRNNYNKSLYSMLTFKWIFPFIKLGNKVGLTQSLHDNLPQEIQSQNSYQKLEKQWNYYFKQKNASQPLLKSIIFAFKEHLLIHLLLRILIQVLSIIEPIILTKIIDIMETSQGNNIDCLPYVFVLICFQVIENLLSQQCWFRNSLYNQQVKGATVSLIFKKAERVSIISSKDYNVGEMTSLFQDCVNNIGGLFWVSFSIILAVVLMYQEMGWNFLIGFITINVFVLIQGWNENRVCKLHQQMGEQGEDRVKKITEICNSIQYIKSEAKEEYYYNNHYLKLINRLFLKKIYENREKQIITNKKRFINYTQQLCLGTSLIPIAVSSTIAHYILYGEELTTKRIILIICLYQKIQWPLESIPKCYTWFFNCYKKVMKIMRFLKSEEIDTSYIEQTLDINQEYAIDVQNGNFAWKPEQQSDDAQSVKKYEEQKLNNENEDLRILKDLNYKIKKGSMVGIFGDIGAGKSSLIYSLIGEMRTVGNPKVKINGRTSLVNQKPWIMNCTVKDNILFNQDFDEKRYSDCIKYACLEADLKIMKNGDNTMIGEEGVTLSGGQKARLALARAIYSDAHILLLDDILSAVDVEVGTSILKDCLINYKGDTTRVIVTHALYYMKYMDYIYMMDKGSIIEEGTYEEIQLSDKFNQMSLKLAKQQSSMTVKSNQDQKERKISENQDDDDMDYIEILPQLSMEKQVSSVRPIQIIQAEDDKIYLPNQSSQQEELQQNDEDSSDDYLPVINLDRKQSSKRKSSIIIQDMDGEKLYDDLTLEEDNKKGDVQFEVYRRFAKEYGGIIVFIFIIVLYLVRAIYQAKQTIALAHYEQNSGDGSGIQFLKQHILLDFVSVSCLLMISILVFVGAIKIQRNLHQAMMKGLLYAPLNEFFERVPVGRILNKFTSNIGTLDNDIYWHLFWSLFNMCNMVQKVIIIVNSSGYNVLCFIFLFVVPCHLITKFCKKTIKEIDRLADESKSPIISSLIQSINGLPTLRAFNKFNIVFSNFSKIYDENIKNEYVRDAMYKWQDIRISSCSNIINGLILIFTLVFFEIDSGSLAILLTYLFSLSGMIRGFLNSRYEWEDKLTNIEKCFRYADLEPEQGYKKFLQSKAENKDLPEKYQGWPDKGVIEFQDVHVKYRKNLDPVLNGLNCKINSGEKIGIVGRTGAGKSTITKCILRILHPFIGKILVDGKDISQISLHELRQKITIILQDPSLFEGTLRSNIDPEGKYTDEELLKTLKDCHLEQLMSSRKGLDTELDTKGSNLSVGEQQLVVIARAILKKSKVVLIDEATANIDMETDKLIQKTLKKEFKDCTVLTIAHRLNTIMDSDRILVMDKGINKEFDTPSNLLKDENSILTKLYNSAKSEEKI